MAGDMGRLPRVAQWILRLVLPRQRRAEVLSDLVESLAAREARLGTAGSSRWLWREVAALVTWRLRTMIPPMGGSPERIEEAGMGRQGLTRDFLRDLRFGMRALVRKPALSVAAIAVLGLGIGASTTVLSLVNAIFFVRPAEVSEPHRLVRVYRSWAPGAGGGALQNSDFEYYRAAATTLSGLAAYGGETKVSFSLDGADSGPADVTPVSDNFFDVLGTQAALGRGFVLEEMPNLLSGPWWSWPTRSGSGRSGATWMWWAATST